MRIRNTARIVLIDPDQRILLFQYEDDTIVNPENPVRGNFWVTPGGGLEGDETFEAGAERELWEETGLILAAGPQIWTREVDLVWNGEPIRFHERYFLCHTPTAETTLVNSQELEMRAYRDHRWWTLAELQATTETIFPEDLAEKLNHLLRTVEPGDPTQTMTDKP